MNMGVCLLANRRQGLLRHNAPGPSKSAFRDRQGVQVAANLGFQEAQRREPNSEERQRRRDTIAALLLAPLLVPHDATAGGLDKYVKRRKLDPLASYIPAILVAQAQLLDVPAAAEEVGLIAARSLLRDGAFVGLRDNIRAVGDYAAESIGQDSAKASVKAFFKALENLDQTLFLEIRKESPEVPDSLPDLVDKANTALEKVLSIVPEEDLDKGREMVEVLRGVSSALGNGEGGASEAEAKVAKALKGLI